MDFSRRFENKGARIRHVRTPEGSARFGLPVGAPIVAQDVPYIPFALPGETAGPGLRRLTLANRQWRETYGSGLTDASVDDAFWAAVQGAGDSGSIRNVRALVAQRNQERADLMAKMAELAQKRLTTRRAASRSPLQDAADDIAYEAELRGDFGGQFTDIPADAPYAPRETNVHRLAVMLRAWRVRATGNLWEQGLDDLFWQHVIPSEDDPDGMLDPSWIRDVNAVNRRDEQRDREEQQRLSQQQAAAEEAARQAAASAPPVLSDDQYYAYRGLMMTWLDDEDRMHLNAFDWQMEWSRAHPEENELVTQFLDKMIEGYIDGFSGTLPDWLVIRPEQRHEKLVAENKTPAVTIPPDQQVQSLLGDAKPLVKAVSKVIADQRGKDGGRASERVADHPVLAPVVDLMKRTFEMQSSKGWKSVVEERSYGTTVMVNRDGTTKMRIQGVILDDAGNQAGKFTRTIDIDPYTPDTPYTVYNDMLEIDSRWQGQGFAEEFYLHAETSLAAQGYERVAIHANIDVGGYAWARRGFGWDGDSACQNVSSHIEARLYELRNDGGQGIWTGHALDGGDAPYHHMNPRYIAHMQSFERRLNDPRLPIDKRPTPWDIAALGEDDPSAHWLFRTYHGTYIDMWPGKWLMLGSDWTGVKPITRHSAPGVKSHIQEMDYLRLVRDAIPFAESAYVPGEYIANVDSTDFNVMSADLFVSTVGAAPVMQDKSAKPAIAERESVIIALLPAEDDPIHGVSSEKHAHVTVVFLGSLDPSMDDSIHEAVRHAATTIKPVTLPITSREPLGDNNADVLMLDVTEFQSVYDMLTHDPAVSAAMRYAEQYPKWTPHLTLGYPEDPAKADLDQTTIRFDRMSLWIGDSVGQTFTLGERVKPNRLQTKVRYVRTPEGREKYGLPIGSPIYAQPDVPLEAYSPEWDAVVTEHLDAHDAADARITDDSTVADEGFDRTVWRGLRMDLPPDLAARLRASYDSPTGPENTLLIHEVGAELLHMLRTHRGGYSARGPEGRSGIGIHWTTSRRFAAIAEQQGGDGQYGFCIQAQIRDEDVASEKMIERTVGTWGDGKGGGDEDEWTMDPFATVRITALTLWGDEKRNLLGEPVDVSLTDGPNVMQDATDYRIAHQPPDIDDGNTLDDMTMMMPDYIERPDLYGFDDMSLETAKLAHGNPDQLVRVYRAVPRSVDTINPGDWVTTSRDYALQHSLYEEGTTHVIFATVRAGDITTDGNSPMEYGYMGEKPMKHASMAPIPLKVTASTKDYKPGDTLQGNRVVDPEELPDTMYHVTTAMRAVMDSDGVLRAANGNEQAGMGGGHQGTVSLTTDRQTAEQILADMNLYRDMVNMDSVEDVMRAFLDLPDVDVASKEQMAQMRAYVDGGFDGEPPILFREAKYGVPSLAHYLLGSYFVHRRSQLGIQNPLIIVVGKTNPFVGMNPDDIGILEVEKSSLNPRAALTDYDLREPMPYTLHEVRVHGDVQTRRI